MSRHTRQRKAKGRSRVGERFTVEVGPVAHGGHCVARVPTGDGDETRVVFVRHAIPGERVVLEVTEGTDGDRFWRADAVEVRDASSDRVEAPCPVAGPGLCGGCDFQHVAIPAQRALKTQVVREQLVRIGKFDAHDPLVTGLEVEAVPGDEDGLRWRTRVQYARTADGRRGMHPHRSRDVIPVDDCLIASRDAREIPSAQPGTPILETVEVGGVEHAYAVEADGFWQVHPGAPRVLVGTVLDLLDPQPGEAALDLYAGVGLFTRFLRDRVGPDARVVAVEGDRAAARHARTNVPAVVATGSVDRVLAESYDEPFDLVVLDPPREGAKKKVVDQVVDRAPRAVAYVACDPAALARDLALFAERGYRLTRIRAFDLFPMTHHVECVALLER
ncbi:class I SAM-dependent RNA methyltransferase [Nocardioides sp. GCM10027113]|uniref:class I SAM-dependent RNA methyltransferase n=1 Tax=unclassified Nocardioides TaxID=2615069 RepID=UPI0036240527